jgi:hypothetical protein
VGNGSETMEQHSRELNDQNQSEEEHKDQTDGLKLQIFLRDVDLNFLDENIEIKFLCI